MNKNLSFDAVIFDMDGVITKTALTHAAAWKKMFDEYLLKREKEHGEKFVEFTHENDYLPFVDGKPRYMGVASFLESRGINIPFGDPADAPGVEEKIGYPIDLSAIPRSSSRCCVGSTTHPNHDPTGERRAPLPGPDRFSTGRCTWPSRRCFFLWRGRR